MVIYRGCERLIKKGAKIGIINLRDYHGVADQYVRIDVASN